MGVRKWRGRTENVAGPKRMENKYADKLLYRNVHHITRIRKKWKQPKRPQLERQNVAPQASGVLFGIKRRGILGFMG